MSRQTTHGYNIANQIEEDAFGASEPLTTTDLWHILDQLHTHYMEKNHIKEKKKAKILDMLGKWMDQLERLDPDIDTI